MFSVVISKSFFASYLFFVFNIFVVIGIVEFIGFEIILIIVFG